MTILTEIVHGIGQHCKWKQNTDIREMGFGLIAKLAWFLKGNSADLDNREALQKARVDSFCVFFDFVWSLN